MSEFMHPPLAPATEGRIIFSPALTPPISGEPLWPPEMQAYSDIFPPPDPPRPSEIPTSTREIQEKVRREWLPLRGEIDVADLVDVFAYKTTHFRLQLESLSPQEMEGNMTASQRETFVRRVVNSQVGCIDILTELGHDANQLVEEKLDVVDEKYDANSFTELRLYGPPESPGRMTVREAAKYLKANYDKDTGIQNYQFRGLPVPEEEEKARFADLSPFQNWQQLRIAEWQVRAFGSDLSVSGSIVPNMFSEYEEFMAEFERLTPAQINQLKDNQDSQAWRDAGEEGADFLISSMGLLSAWEICFQQGLTRKVDRMKHDFKYARTLRSDHNYSPLDALKAIREAKHRVKHGRPVPYKLAAILHLV